MDEKNDINRTITHPDLLPCPFCGYKASMTNVESQVPGHFTWIVGCDSEDCDVSFHGHARQVDAAKAWNTRISLGPKTLSETTADIFRNGFVMPLKVNDYGDCVVDQEGNIVADFTLNGDPDWTDYDLEMIVNHIADAINAYTPE